MPKAPRQLPSPSPRDRASPTARANSGLDKFLRVRSRAAGHTSVITAPLVSPSVTRRRNECTSWNQSRRALRSVAFTRTLSLCGGRADPQLSTHRFQDSIVSKCETRTCRLLVTLQTIRSISIGRPVFKIMGKKEIHPIAVGYIFRN